MEDPLYIRALIFWIFIIGSSQDNVVVTAKHGNKLEFISHISLLNALFSGA